MARKERLRKAEQGMTLLIAEGPSFTFHVIAGTEQEARSAFASAWRRHAVQTGATPDPEDAVTINVICHMRFGVVYRDYMPLR